MLKIARFNLSTFLEPSINQSYCFLTQSLANIYGNKLVKLNQHINKENENIELKWSTSSLTLSFLNLWHQFVQAWGKKVCAANFRLCWVSNSFQFGVQKFKCFETELKMAWQFNVSLFWRKTVSKYCPLTRHWQLETKKSTSWPNEIIS